MPGFQRKWLVVAGVAATLGMCSYFRPQRGGPQLVMGPTSVSYDLDAARLTTIVNIQNSGDRPMVLSITNDVFIDSQKQPSNDPSQPQPRRTALLSKQSTPVTFNLEGDRAAAVWSGVRLMEVTINAAYDANATLHCNFRLMGRFYPEAKEIGIVSSVTSPRECRGR
jgi:hypothetical protein